MVSQNPSSWLFLGAPDITPNDAATVIDAATIVANVARTRFDNLSFFYGCKVNSSIDELSVSSCINYACFDLENVDSCSNAGGKKEAPDRTFTLAGDPVRGGDAPGNTLVLVVLGFIAARGGRNAIGFCYNFLRCSKSKVNGNLPEKSDLFWFHSRA